MKKIKGDIISEIFEKMIDRIFDGLDHTLVYL